MDLCVNGELVSEDEDPTLAFRFVLFAVAAAFPSLRFWQSGEPDMGCGGSSP